MVNKLIFATLNSSQQIDCSFFISPQTLYIYEVNNEGLTKIGYMNFSFNGTGEYSGVIQNLIVNEFVVCQNSNTYPADILLEFFKLAKKCNVQTIDFNLLSTVNNSVANTVSVLQAVGCVNIITTSVKNSLGVTNFITTGTKQL